MGSPEQATILTTKVRVPTQSENAFAEWQAKFNAKIAAFSGFVSLEISSPTGPHQTDWMINQRFYGIKNVLAWRESKEREELIDELKTLLIGNDPDAIQETEVKASDLLQGVVTEVFITQVSPGKDHAFLDLISKIHKVEAKFPGFRGVYVQSPSSTRGKNWITLLRFDTPENLDHWLTSPERKKVLNELNPLIASIESHRVISPYAGWFSSLSNKGDLPPVWKQSMLVLLALFPIVMLEIKFLIPFTQYFGSSLSTFIGNALSVTLIAWPMMPIAIRYLGWWLTSDHRWTTTRGIIVLFVLYALEVAVFWLF